MITLVLCRRSTDRAAATAASKQPAHAAPRLAYKSDDTGPAVLVRFANAIGEWNLRPASLLTSYPDGTAHVRMADTQVRCFVHGNSIVAIPHANA